MFPTNMNIKILSFLSVITLCSAGFTGYDEEQWQKAADFLKEGYNSSADPCRNFTQYSCGKWYETERIQNSQFVVQAGQIYQLGIAAANKVDENDKKTPKYKKTIKFFINYCMNNNKSITEIDLYKAIAKIMGDLFNKNEKGELTFKNVWYLMGFVQRQFPLVSNPFRVTVQPATVVENYKIAALHFVPGYRVMLPINKSELSQKMSHLVSSLNVNVSKEIMSKKIDDIAALHQALSKLLNDSQKTSVEEFKNFLVENRWNVKNLYVASELNTKFPGISWTDFFQGLFTAEQYKYFDPDSTFVNFEEIEFFQKINGVFAKFDNETIFNYMFYKIFERSSLVINDLESCLDYAFKCFASGLTRMIADENGYNLMEWRADIQLITETVLAATKYLFAGASWLDDSEKIKLITKVNQITYYPGVPTWIMNETEVDRRTLTVNDKISPIENVFTILKGNFERYLDLVVRLDDPSLDAEPSLEANANYWRFHILLYLGYMFPPWYHPRYPLAVKYGNVGYVIGHELFHAFDANNIDEKPELAKSWLTACTKKEYYKKVDCLKKQYSGVCSSVQKQCLSGAMTVGENMADIDGLKVAYMAYKFATMTAGKDNALPGLTDLDGDQLFFLTSGRVHCASDSDFEGWVKDRNDVHSPQLLRLEMPLKNFDVFSKAFKCKAGSFYDPAHTCTIWADYNGATSVEY